MFVICGACTYAVLQEGIFLEESSKYCSLFNNTCRRNKNGIALYTLTVGPVTNHFVINNMLIGNQMYGLSVGGLGHGNQKKRSVSNVRAIVLVSLFVENPCIV